MKKRQTLTTTEILRLAKTAHLKPTKITPEQAKVLPSKLKNFMGFKMAIKVTPQIAEIWNGDKFKGTNRRKRKAHVKRMAHDIVKKNWKRQPQPITFSNEGLVIDGQHRIDAVIMSNKEAVIEVTFGWPKEVQKVVDGGTGRSVIDTANIFLGDSVISGMHVKTTRAVMFTPFNGGRSRVFTNIDILDFMNANMKSIAFTIDAFGKKNTKHITVACVMGAVARAHMKGANRTRLREFCNTLLTGEYNGAKDLAALRLRNYLLENWKMLKGGTGREITYKKATTALKAYLVEEPLIRIEEAQQELFPIYIDSTTDVKD